MSNVHHSINGDCKLIGCPECKARTDKFIKVPLFSHDECQAKHEIALKLIEEMAGALEHYESAHYTDDNGVCAWDKTATKALESYRKFKGE